MGSAGPTPTGPQSTFNYLIDALLAVPDLRSMYLRRLRSLMDEYTNGKLAGVTPPALGLLGNPLSSLTFLHTGCGDKCDTGQIRSEQELLWFTCSCDSCKELLYAYHRLL